MKRFALFLAILGTSLCISCLVILAIFSRTVPLASVTPLPTATALSPTPARTPPTPTLPMTPASDEARRTLDKLLTTKVSESDLYALTARLKKPSEPIHKIVRETPIPYQVNAEEKFWVLDEPNKKHYEITATLRLITPHTYVWVEKERQVDEAALAKSLQVFEDKIYPTTRRIFGSEWTPGVDSDPRLHIVNLYIPGAVLGYFSGPDEYPKIVNPFSNEREAIYMDIQRLRPGTATYESVLAHEFQHMIHWNNDKNEDAWVNEGLSVLSSQLNGYDPGGYDRLFTQVPDTQLNAWSDEPDTSLPHYGAAYLFMLYFLERFGDAALRGVIADPANGPAGFDNALKAKGLTFNDVFADWTIANLLDDPALDVGRYGYRDLRVGTNIEIRHTRYPVQRQTSVYQYAADYIELRAPADQVVNATLTFTGAPTVKLVPNEPHSGKFQWWSNRGDDSDMTLTRALDLRGVTKATLRAWLWYDIEKDYDYAYIEVSTDGGKTWDILKGPRTTDTNPNGNSFGHAYTGKSGSVTATPSPPAPRSTPAATSEWVQETIDLAAYAGKQILLRFEYITDAVYTAPGLALDDVEIPEIGFRDDAETCSGWIVEGFICSNNTIPQTFSVQIVKFGAQTTVEKLPLDASQRGQITLTGLGKDFQRAMLVVSGLAPVTTEAALYEYSVTTQ